MKTAHPGPRVGLARPRRKGPAAAVAAAASCVVIAATAIAGCGTVGAAAREDLVALITTLTDQMHAAAAELQFELAARFRDEVRELKQELRGMQAAGV